MKKRLWLKIPVGCVAAVLLLAAAGVAYLTITEYRPAAQQPADLSALQNENAAAVNGQLTVYSWNIGYAGLGAAADFFMDGGSEVNPAKEEVTENLAAVQRLISSRAADAWLLQEVDVRSARSSYINEADAVAEAYAGSLALAYNYSCRFVPIPLPPIGRVESGIATLTDKYVNGTPERIALPCPFSWPVSVANLKRCLLVTRLAVEGSDKEAVLINLHLEAYDDGEGKLAQTRQLMELLQQEYEKGNYVIAGGDFNQAFPHTSETYPVAENVWTPGILEESALPEGFRYVFDEDSPTCRLLDAPLSDSSQLYIIDGFIVSPNLQVELVETQELQFANTDHNPVKLQVTLLP